jgi:hypothetical protein
VKTRTVTNWKQTKQRNWTESIRINKQATKTNKFWNIGTTYVKTSETCKRIRRGIKGQRTRKVERRKEYDKNS